MNDRSALVPLSGGQDSATCLVWALDRSDHVETLAFDHGQRHRRELDAAASFRAALPSAAPRQAQRLAAHRGLALPALAALSDAALTREVDIALGADGLPTTFVPGRNLLFVTFAAALAYMRGLRHLVADMCETDYSGYPDCRDDTLKALQLAINLGMERRFVLHTRLMWRDKAATWHLAHALGGAPLVALIRDTTLFCYRGDIRRHGSGMGCGNCPACALRQHGWERYAEAQQD